MARMYVGQKTVQLPQGGMEVVNFEDMLSDYTVYPVRGEDGVWRRRSRGELVRDLGRVGVSIRDHP